MALQPGSVLLVILLVLGMVALAVLSRRGRAARKLSDREKEGPGGLSGSDRGTSKRCDWEKDGPAGETLQRYRCTTCGLEAFSGTGKPPVDCKRGLGPRPL